MDRSWLKVKCPDWKAENEYRHLLFEGPKKQVPSERKLALMKKRDELARIQQQLLQPGVSLGMMRELRKRETILEREIAELERPS